MNIFNRGKAVLGAGTCIALAGCGATAASAPGASTAATASSQTASVSVAAGSGAASSTAGSGASIPFPTAVGTTWVYILHFVTVGDTGTATDKVVSAVSVPGGRQVTILHTTDLGAPPAHLIFLFHPDGSITYPFTQVGGQTVHSDGILWPPASVIASGQPVRQQTAIHTGSHTDIVQTTVQGAGTATVTVPAGTYQARIVNVTMAIPMGGASISVEVRTWFADGVGPVKEEVLTTGNGKTTVTLVEELTSYTKG